MCGIDRKRTIGRSVFFRPLRLNRAALKNAAAQFQRWQFRYNGSLQVDIKRAVAICVTVHFDPADDVLGLKTCCKKPGSRWSSCALQQSRGRNKHRDRFHAPMSWTTWFHTYRNLRTNLDQFACQRLYAGASAAPQITAPLSNSGDSLRKFSPNGLLAAIDATATATATISMIVGIPAPDQAHGLLSVVPLRWLRGRCSQPSTPRVRRVPVSAMCRKCPRRSIF
jgi:hypothetical protein